MRRFLALFLLLFLCFVAAPAFPEQALFSFAVIGDSGCGCPAQQAVADQMIRWYGSKPYPLVLMLGDNIYSEGFSLSSFWRGTKQGGDPRLFDSRFDKYYQPLLDKGVRFQAVLGNHDIETNDGRDELNDSRFHFIGNRAYYVYSPQPLISFFAINSNSFVGRSVDPRQIDWLKDALKGDHAIWKIAFYHHPIYSPPGTHAAEKNLRREIEPVLVAGGIQIAFNGHNHLYARFKPQKGIVHFTSGGGGRYLKTPLKSDILEQAERVFHFLYFDVYPDHLEFWAVDYHGKIIDHGSILRQPNIQ